MGEQAKSVEPHCNLCNPLLHTRVKCNLQLRCQLYSIQLSSNVQVTKLNIKIKNVKIIFLHVSLNKKNTL